MDVYRIFDVAKWSEKDILDTMEQLDISMDEDNEVETELFVKAVIRQLEVNFNGDIGINWESIINAVRQVERERRENEHRDILLSLRK